MAKHFSKSLGSESTTQASVEGAPSFRYATLEEVMELYKATLPNHEEAYRELAKGPEGVGPHDAPPFDLRKW